nr:TAXI family TRAP transporter solute-binding subunit [Motilibacter aurantiacus]
MPLALLALAVRLLVPPSSPEAGGALVIATGGVKGVYFEYGRAVAALAESELDGVSARVEPTTGSVENIRGLVAGRFTVAFSASDVAADAVRGRPPFTAPLPLQALGRIYDDYVHLVVPASSPAQSVRDLVGQRVSLGSPGSGTEVIADRVLAAAGLSRDDVRERHLSLSDSADALRAGRLDAFFWSGGLPSGGVTELAASLPIRLLPLGDAAEQLRERYGASYRTARTPAATYRGVEPVETIAIANYLLTRPDAPAGLVEGLTRLLFDLRDDLARDVPLAARLDRGAAIFTEPVPLHAGAERYYRRVKA